MAIAQLSLVTLLCPRKELGILLARLCRFGLFHPSDRDGLVQDVGLLLLSSRAHLVYSETNQLLPTGVPTEGVKTPTQYGAHDPLELVDLLTAELQEVRSNLLQRNLSEASKLELYRALERLREIGLMTFKNLSRVKVFPGTGRFVFLEGFVPSDSLKFFRDSIGEYFFSAEKVEKRRSKEPYVPSLFVNPRVVSLFENITLSSGVPKYNEIDPTPVVALVFPLFFGIMFSDLGHGIVLLTLGLFLAWRPESTYRYWGRLLSMFSISAMAFGIVRGSFFGFELPYHELLPLPAVLMGSLTLQSVTVWLVIAVIVGTFHLASGYALAIVNRVRSGDYAEAFLSQLPTLVLYSAIIPFVLALYGVRFQWSLIFASDSPTPLLRDIGGTNVTVSLVASISFPLVVFSFLTLVTGRFFYASITAGSMRTELESLGNGLLDGLLRPVEFLMNTVSYTRLGILLMVGAILGSLVSGVYNQGPFGIVLAVIGNLAIMAIEGFIVYVQDLRLHLYEWFTKFYTGLGKPFLPLVSTGELSVVKWL